MNTASTTVRRTAKAVLRANAAVVESTAPGAGVGAPTVAGK